MVIWIKTQVHQVI